MDHPTQPAPAQTTNLTSVQSALAHLREITNAGDGRQSNAFMWAVINNLCTSIGSTPNPILSACYPTKVVGRHLLRWIKEFLAHNRLVESLCSVDPPLLVAGPSSFGIGDRSACNRTIVRHAQPSDPIKETLLELVRVKIVAGLVSKVGPSHLGKSCGNHIIQRCGSISAPCNSLNPSHLNMSAPPNFTNFAFCCGQGVPSDWTEDHTRSLYNSIIADPIQCTKSAWTPAHICWMMKSIWFCDKTARLSRVTGMDASALRRQRTAVFRWICPFICCFCHASIRENAVRSPSFCRDLSNLVGEYWLATSDPVSSDVDTGPSDGEGNRDEDLGYGVAQPPATPMDFDPPAPEGEPSGNELGKEWQVASEMRADLALAQAATTLAGLVAYGATSDDGSGEEEEEVDKKQSEKEKNTAGRREDEKAGDADNEGEEEEEVEEEVNELQGGEVSDSAPKTKGYTCTGWPAHLNQQLRQGKTQPAMCTYMVEMEEEGLLKASDEKCNRCHGGRRCLLPVESDNGHPACAECLISSHGCPNCVACAAPVRKKPACSTKGKAKVGPTPARCLQAFMLVPCMRQGHPAPASASVQPEAAMDLLDEYNMFSSCPMQSRPPLGHDAVIDFTFNLEERCSSGLSHPREVAWDQILALTHQLVVAHRALEYKLRRSGPFSDEEVEHFLQTCYPNSMLPVDEEQPGNAERKGDA
ncbi:hypothetical protein EDD85DRAFT_791783 [Armillaria nabsnona]|nr:hypothetical protein EDD85DRAFT_791783 [Armillaria nabsnona]